MFKFIEGMPPGVVAIEAIGEVTHEDYRDTLVPRAKTMVGNGPIKMIYVIGKDFKRFKLEALWDDSMFGIKYGHDFSYVAVVTDHEWLRAVISIFKPFIHAEVRLFSLSELPAAKDWITSAKEKSIWRS
jgi:hypothetical protein